MQISYIDLCAVIRALNARLPDYLWSTLAANIVKKAKSGEYLLTVSGATDFSVEALSTMWVELCPRGTLEGGGLEEALLGYTPLGKGSGFRGLASAKEGVERFLVALWHEGNRLDPNEEAGRERPYLIIGTVGSDVAKVLNEHR